MLNLAVDVMDVGTTRALLAVAAVVFILFILNRSARRRRMGAGRRREAVTEANEAARMQRLKREVEQVVVELHEFVREMNGQLDTRFAKLEKSLADADRRIADLRALQGRPARSEADPAVSRANVEAAAGVRSPRRDAPVETGEQRVYRLFDAGQSPMEIARTLQCSVGEVELILNLRGRR